MGSTGILVLILLGFGLVSDSGLLVRHLKLFWSLCPRRARLALTYAVTWNFDMH